MQRCSMSIAECSRVLDLHYTNNVGYVAMLDGLEWGVVSYILSIYYLFICFI